MKTRTDPPLLFPSPSFVPLAVSINPWRSQCVTAADQNFSFSIIFSFWKHPWGLYDLRASNQAQAWWNLTPPGIFWSYGSDSASPSPHRFYPLALLGQELQSSPMNFNEEKLHQLLPSFVVRFLLSVKDTDILFRDISVDLDFFTFYLFVFCRIPPKTRNGKGERL